MVDRIYKTQAVVLRRYDFGETGKQLVIYTPALGKLSAIAKGVKRATSKMAGHLEPLSLAHVVVAHGRNLDTVTQADTVQSFADLRSDPDRFFQAFIAVELLDKLTPENEPNLAIWDLFVDTLRRLDSEEDAWVALTYFQVRMLLLTGYRPELNECVVCGGELRADASYYSPPAGGTCCHNCRTSSIGVFATSANAIKVLRAAIERPYDQFRRLRTGSELRGEVSGLLRVNLRGLLDLELESSRLLERLPASHAD